MSDDKLDPLFTLEPQAAVPGTEKLAPAVSTEAEFSLQWAAGFVDGEGCFYLFRQTYLNPRRRATYRLGFCITQNHLPVLEHFRKGMEITQILYKVKPRPGLTRQVYTLNCTGKSALRVITLLYPYLIRKKLEAETAFDYWQKAKGGKRPRLGRWSAQVIAKREHYFQKMKTLK